jgi:hypothetical protein
MLQNSKFNIFSDHGCILFITKMQPKCGNLISVITADERGGAEHWNIRKYYKKLVSTLINALFKKKYITIYIYNIVLEYLMNKLSSQTPKNYNKNYNLVWARI